MLTTAFWKSVALCPLVRGQPLLNSSSLLVRTRLAHCTSTPTELVGNIFKSKPIENTCFSRAVLKNSSSLKSNVSTSNFDQDKVTDYLNSKSVWDNNPKCDRTPYCESKDRAQRMDEIEEKLKGPKKYRKLANYFPELRDRNKAQNGGKKQFSTCAALCTKYKIPGTKPRRRGAPYTPEELITIHDIKFAEIRRQLEGNCKEHIKDNPKRAKCPTIRGRLQHCGPIHRPDCVIEGVPLYCTKVECPYPCYVDCKDLDQEPTFSECLLCPLKRATIRAKKLAKKCDP